MSNSDGETEKNEKNYILEHVLNNNEYYIFTVSTESRELRIRFLHKFDA